MYPRLGEMLTVRRMPLPAAEFSQKPLLESDWNVACEGQQATLAVDIEDADAYLFLDHQNPFHVYQPYPIDGHDVGDRDTLPKRHAL